jgi:competence protein ComEC
VLYPIILLSTLVDHPFLAKVSGWVASEITGILSQAVMALQLKWICPRWALLAGLAGAAFICVLRLRVRTALAILIAGRLLLEVSPAPRSRIQIEQLDVGQGDAALVSDSGTHGLIDTGSERALSPQGWVTLFAERSITRIDWIALTHLDEDHAGGVLTLASLIPIGCVVASSAEMDSPRGRGFAISLARSGIRVSAWDQGCFPYHLRELQSLGRNGNMTAFAIPFHDGFYLNAGDASAELERELIPWFRSLQLKGSRRILKLSHHGSRFSTSSQFVEAVAPTEAWVSSGVGNQHGHPTAFALDRVAGIPVRRTDRVGVIALSEE